MKTLYLSGPMTGYPECNYPEFHRIAALLRAAGHTVLSPAEVPDSRERDWAEWMKLHIPTMLTCDGIVHLAGWQGSKGARLEHHIAEALGLELYDWRYDWRNECLTPYLPR